MQPESPLAALMAFCGLTLFHVTIILTHRSLLINTGRAKPNDFIKSRHEKEDSFVGRVSSSHANCLENLPLATAVILINHVVDGAPDISQLAWYFVGARVGQALVHWMSVVETMVLIRFVFFFVSKVLLITMAYKTMMG